jgi:hypothetical protein
MSTPKIFIGPMSKNVVDAAIALASPYMPLGLIPSRRQVEWDGGYVNGWTTESWIDYVRGSSPIIVLERDHSGANQGDEKDDGDVSLKADAEAGMDIIHIDPFKSRAKETITWFAAQTVQKIKLVSDINPDCEFEIGTEQAIREYSPSEFDLFLRRVLSGCADAQRKKIKFAVIQSGTSLSGTKNTGNYSPSRLSRMIKICKRLGLKSKEHNGDYLDPRSISNRFRLGLDAINIAPEFGCEETKVYLQQGDAEFRQELFKLCVESNRWQKWFPNNFDPDKHKKEVIEASGHYVFSNPKFKKLKSRLPPNTDAEVQRALRKKILLINQAVRCEL